MHEGRIVRKTPGVGRIHRRLRRYDRRLRQQHPQALKQAVKTQRPQSFGASLVGQHRRAQGFIGGQGGRRQRPDRPRRYRFFGRATARSILRGCTDTPS
jgi:hypothetical protein